VISDLVTVEYARNAILAFWLSGVLLAFVARGIDRDERLATGLFVGQLGALGLIAASVLGIVLAAPIAAVTGAVAVTGVAIALLISHFNSSGNVDTSRRKLFRIGFFLSATLSVMLVSRTNLAYPRTSDVLFGRIFTISLQEIVVLLGVGMIVVLITFALGRYLSGEQYATRSSTLLLAVCAGPIVGLLGVLPFAALVTLLPETRNQEQPSYARNVFVVGTHIVLSGILGIYVALQYGLPGAPTAITILALIAFLRFLFLK